MPNLLVTICAALLSAGVLSASDDPKTPKPKLKLERDVTFVTGPLDAEGYVDYEAALNQRLKGSTTPETNAVVLLLQAYGPSPGGKVLNPDFLKELGVEAPPEQGEYLKGLNEFFGCTSGDRKSKDLEYKASKQRCKVWTTSDATEFSEWIKANEKPLALAVEASRRKDYYDPILSRRPDGSQGLMLNAALPLPQVVREVATLLSLRATLRGGEGNFEAAFEDVLAIHRLGTLTASGGCLIELLVGYALEGIAHEAAIAILNHKDCPSDRAMAYLAELKALPPVRGVAEPLGFCERLSILNMLQWVQRKGMSATNKEMGNDSGGLGGLIGDVGLKFIDWETTFRFANSWFDRIERDLQIRSYAGRAAADDATGMEIRALKAELQDRNETQRVFRDAGGLGEISTLAGEKLGKIFVSNMLPATRKVDQAGTRAEQFRRNGILASALLAYFADHDKYPETLWDLRPTYLADIPEDAFNGKPIVYQKEDKNCRFFSVGINGKDDSSMYPIGSPQGDDTGVHLMGGGVASKTKSLWTWTNIALILFGTTGLVAVILGILMWRRIRRRAKTSAQRREEKKSKPIRFDD